jgi:putative heme-binding domain-containing protein
MILISIGTLPLARAAAQSPASASRPPVQTLEETLRRQPVAELARRVMTQGDAARGALLYYNPVLTCVRCHEPSKDTQVRLGPALAEVNRDATVEFLIESLLHPSRELSEGFQTETILTMDGKPVTGLVLEEDPSPGGFVRLADPANDGREMRIDNDEIEERVRNRVSAMPEGLVGALPDESSFLDLIRYLVEIRRGGPPAELRLRPPQSFFAVAPVPEYEADIDHAGLIGDLDEENFQRGEAIYQRYCARCHGTADEEGTMPSALKFASGAFKNGSDPYAMYQTLTHGYGLMVAQRWMVPRQKYDVIHYIRENFLKTRNPAQHVPVDNPYLASLPAGSGRGPDPVERTPWSDMDYGNFLFNTLEVGDNGSNIALKGLAVRLDQGPGGVSQGRHWMLYEHDTMRVAAAWSGPGFIDYNGIHFNDRHNVHPRIVGDIQWFNPHLPGWANPDTDSFADDPRLVGRDGKPYGPLPASWLKYRGLYRFDDRVVLNYTVGRTAVLESPGLQFVDGQPVFRRTLDLQGRDRPLRVKVASVPDLAAAEEAGSAIFFEKPETAAAERPGFDGAGYLTAEALFDKQANWTVAARLRTARGGTILCQTADRTDWVPGGTSLFIRDGRLVFDIGWVGAVTSRRRIDDNQWHDVALVWQPQSGTVRLYIDGQADRQGRLQSGKAIENPIVRLGYTADNFPRQSAFQGVISNIRVWKQALPAARVASIDFSQPDTGTEADWWLQDTASGDGLVRDRSGQHRDARWQSLTESSEPGEKHLWAIVHGLSRPRWLVEDGSLSLRIPAGSEPLQLEILTGAHDDSRLGRQVMQAAAEQLTGQSPARLSGLTRGGPARYPDVLTTRIETLPASDDDPFAVDILNLPEDNPWSCRLRLTGIDFAGPDCAVVCTWDGSVWEITGFREGNRMTWKRIAHGMFQPLGIRMLNGRLFVTCRDQLLELHDLNDDGFIDYYQAFNSDHQVTEHFHEFAMGLQSDAEGNFYYAKSARHALPAVVPHHGTLLQVSADGTRTRILANGFRAANGVCLNPDGSFFVTDQEGHWTPKNRINWVTGEGGFYGNMLGYHQIEDESDQAMRQPLCWITNAFDRSPGELLWVPGNTWGPLAGSLLNLSYGMGQVFVVPHQSVTIGGQIHQQGGMCALPLPTFPTGVMRGRFHDDGHLYSCGMYAWAGNQQKPGGLYRIRWRDQPAWLPTALQARPRHLILRFTDRLDESASQPDRYSIRTWNIHRTANYGSQHLDERTLPVQSVTLQEDGRSLRLVIPELQPTRCMEIKCRIRTPQGREVIRTIHNTIHQLVETDEAESATAGSR